MLSVVNFVPYDLSFLAILTSLVQKKFSIHLSFLLSSRFVRSLTMDGWPPAHLKAMELGGNSNFLAFMRKYNIPTTLSIQEKFALPHMKVYKDKIKVGSCISNYSRGKKKDSGEEGRWRESGRWARCRYLNQFR